MYNFKQLALTHSASCFMNALFREFHEYKIIASPAFVPTRFAESIEVPLGESRLIIPLKFKSLLGRHQYADLFFLNDKASDFIETVEILSEFLVARYDDSTNKKQIFLRRVANSLHNIEQSLKERASDIESMYKRPLAFADAEQGLMIGHNFHPYPKAREGFDDADFAKYSPEMAGKFGLHWFFVKPEILHNQTAVQFKTHSWTNKLYVTESDGISVPEGYVPFPVHPWQKDRLLKIPVVQKYLKDKVLIDAGASKKIWHPTSSLRSIYASHAPYMLKFSLTLRLTNSIRHLTDVEVVRGLQVYDVLATSKGREFSQRHPHFEIVFEPAFAALKNSDGKVLNESIVVCRENPFQENQDENIVLSTLAQDNPLGGDTLILHHVREYARTTKVSLCTASHEWLARYLDLAIKPFIVAQAEYGILLGAHQQNMILQIQGHLPAKAYFRDCQGTGYSHRGYELYHNEVASLVKENGNILDDKGNILFGYYLLVNSTFNVISAIAHADGACEKELIQQTKDFLLSLTDLPFPDTSFLEYILKRPEIYQKGNFNCSLQNLNENTTANPLAIYNLIPNPFYGVNS